MKCRKSQEQKNSNGYEKQGLLDDQNQYLLEQKETRETKRDRKTNKQSHRNKTTG